MNEINIRIKQKHDTTANWNNKKDFIPLNGELIVYDDYMTEEGTGKKIPGIKIGDGNAFLIDLPFVTGSITYITNIIDKHVEDNVRHIEEQERKKWNNKVSCEIKNSDELVFYTNINEVNK